MPSSKQSSAAAPRATGRRQRSPSSQVSAGGLRLLGFREPDAVAEAIHHAYDPGREQGLRRCDRARLAALRGLAADLARLELPERLCVGRPEPVARYLQLRHLDRDQEVMGALFLDARHRLISEAELFRGTQVRAAVEPRAVLKQALLRSAAAIMLFHTHPSGDPSPSAEDLGFTRRMADAGQLLGVRLVDHLIIGANGRWLSLRRRGGW